MEYRNDNAGGTKPRQKISSDAKNKKWADDSAEYYLGACVDAVDKERAYKNYRLANGHLDESEYLYVTNPLNTNRPELMGYPAKLQNFDIITPILSLLMGEKARRMFPPIVYARNSNHYLHLAEEETKLLIAELQKRFINETVQMGLPFEEERITMELEQIGARIKKLPDALASMGQDVLEAIMDFNQLPRQFRKGFYDWFAQFCVYSYKDVHKDETYYEILSPIHVGYLCSPQHDFIKHGEAVRCSHFLSVNEIYDRFQDVKGFDGEVSKFIDDHSNVSSSTGYSRGYRVGSTDVGDARMEFFDRLFGTKAFDDFSEGMRVDHVMWRSQAKIGKLIRQDIFGQVEEIEVDDTFKPVDGDMITWEWKDEIWENYKIADRYWIGAQRVPIQNQNKPELLYNGRNMFSRHTRPKSLAERGEAYQKAVNIVKYRAEATLAKNLDKVILFPLGLIPKKEGWDEDKLMYYVRAFSFLFFDETRPNAHLLIQAMKDLDMSSLQHVLQAYQLVQIFKQEWEEACGINAQRKGDVGVSAGKGVTLEAQDRSYVMSEELFLEYEEFEKEEYQSMMELSKYAFSNGKKAYFIRPDGTKAFLDLHDPETFLWADFGVYVKNGSRELRKLEMLREQVTAFAQNQVDPKMIATIIEAENFAKLHEVMDDIDAKMEMREQRNLAVQQEATAAQERIAAAQEKFNYYKEDLASTTDLQVALIQAGMKVADDMRKLEASGENKGEKYENLRTDLEKNAMELMKNATKLKEIDAKIKMNKLDNKTALANKVAGEK